MRRVICPRCFSKVLAKHLGIRFGGWAPDFFDMFVFFHIDRNGKACDFSGEYAVEIP